MKSIPLWCAVVALAAIPLTLPKPGLPLSLRAGEAGNYLMARSLIEDGDLRYDGSETARLFEEFPYTHPISVEVEVNGNERYFAAAALYPILVAFPIHIFGANGAIAFNMVCFVLALIVQVRLHRQRLGETRALTVVGGLFVLSTAFAYVFQLRSEVMLFAGVAIALALVTAPNGRRSWRSALAGFLLTPAIVAVPTTAILLVSIFSWRRALKPALALVAGLIAGLILANGLDRALTLAAPASVVELRIDNPYVIEPVELGEGTVHWQPSKMRSLITAFFGRYTGFLPYLPFGFFLIGLAFVGRERANERRLLALALLVTIASTSMWSPIAAAEQASTLGNPSLIPLLPFFTLLVESLPAFSLPIAWAWSMLWVGPMLSSLLGIVVPGGDVASHTRSFPFRSLPFEDHLLPHLQGYEAFTHPQATLWAPTTRVKAAGDQVWILGGTSAELWLVHRGEPLTDAVIDVRTTAPNNEIIVEGLGERQVLRVGELTPGGSTHRLALGFARPTRRHSTTTGPVHLSRFTVSTAKGQAPRWDGQGRQSYYIGAAISFLGSQAYLDRDVFGIEWLGCGAPAIVETGEGFRAVARLRNTSPFPWQTIGAARVRLGHRWVPDGVPASERTDFDEPLGPQEQRAIWQNVRAPRSPGSYSLQLEPVFESVAWFSDRADAPSSTRCLIDVEVVENEPLLSPEVKENSRF